MQVNAGHAAIDDIHPKRKSMLLAVFSSGFVSFEGFVEPVHLGQNMGAPHSDGSSRVRIVTAESSSFVVLQRFREPSEAIVKIPKGGFDQGEIARIMGLFESRTGWSLQPQGLFVSPQIR